MHVVLEEALNLGWNRAALRATADRRAAAARSASQVRQQMLLYDRLTDPLALRRIGTRCREVLPDIFDGQA